LDVSPVERTVVRRIHVASVQMESTAGDKEANFAKMEGL